VVFVVVNGSFGDGGGSGVDFCGGYWWLMMVMFEDFGTTFVYVVSSIVVLALFWCFYLLISEITLC